MSRLFVSLHFRVMNFIVMTLYNTIFYAMTFARNEFLRYDITCHDFLRYNIICHDFLGRVVVTQYTFVPCHFTTRPFMSRLLMWKKKDVEIEKLSNIKASKRKSCIDSTPRLQAEHHTMTWSYWRQNNTVVLSFLPSFFENSQAEWRAKPNSREDVPRGPVSWWRSRRELDWDNYNCSSA